MAKELHEKELQIKKTARRRLVGAIAMVVILLVVLPFVLKDQATDSAQDPVKITIVNEAANSEPIPELDDGGQKFESNVNPTEVSGYSQTTVLPSQQDEQKKVADIKSNETPVKQTAQQEVAIDTKQKAELEKQQADKIAQEKALQEKLIQEKALEEEKIKQEKAKEAQTKEAQTREAQAKQEKNKQDIAVPSTKSTTKFYVQYGVFSEPKNLEKLQSELKLKGFTAETDNIDTAGKKIRLRSNTYPSKEAALKALETVQAAGFSAIVIAK